ncbi:hypothetical protein [Halorhabdus rudnickae]|uniref:hypothetical protein n=1 Tax=Halorhabdus rudnickae TaxID=1775544 RepID=UPI001082FE43|nr:hypothetical protein [Halorhabdus rudnickae]
MDRTERALASFLDGDEELVETWTVDTINRGFELSPPGMGDSETLGLTDRRLLWLDDELETVDLEVIRHVDHESVRPHSTPLLLTVGALALVLGALATPALWLLASLSTVETLAPLAVGVGLFVVTSVLSHVRDGDVDDDEHFHYLELRTERTTVQIYADLEIVDAIGERIESKLS